MSCNRSSTHAPANESTLAERSLLARRVLVGRHDGCRRAARRECSTSLIRAKVAATTLGNLRARGSVCPRCAMPGHRKLLKRQLAPSLLRLAGYEGDLRCPLLRAGDPDRDLARIAIAGIAPPPTRPTIATVGIKQPPAAMLAHEAGLDDPARRYSLRLAAKAGLARLLHRLAPDLLLGGRFLATFREPLLNRCVRDPRASRLAVDRCLWLP